MAALAATKLTSIVLSEANGLAGDGTVTAGVSKPGRRLESWNITGTLAAASATEWLATDLLRIEAVIGNPVLQGTTALASSEYVMVLNAQGTGVAAETNLGDLGIELTAGTAIDQIVTVIGTFDGNTS